MVPQQFLHALADPEVSEELSSEIAQTFDQTFDTLAGGLNLEQIYTGIKSFAVSFFPRLAMALVIYLVGNLMIRLLISLFKRIFLRSKLEATFHSFIISSIRILLTCLLIITCLGTLNMPLTPLITALGAAGLAISLAMQGTLSNIAGGISILFTRPFEQNDFVDIGGTLGTVREIGLFYTVLSTIDNKNVYMPNADVSSSTIINYSAQPVRRLDLLFSISRGSDIDKAKEIILEAIKNNELALKDPAPIVRAGDQTFALIKLACQVWVQPVNLLILNGQLIEAIRKRFSEEGIQK